MQRSTLPLLSTLILFAAPASALTDEQQCSAAKWKAAGRHAQCLLRADARAIRSDGAPDYSQCDRKLRFQYTRAELKWNCDIEDEVPNVQSLLNLCVEGVRTATASAAPGVVSVERGWECDGPAPSGCAPICGDGIIAGENDCDADTQFCPDGPKVAFGDGLTVCGTSSDEPNLSVNRFFPQAGGIDPGDCSRLPRPTGAEAKVYRYLNIPYGDAYAPVPTRPNSNTTKPNSNSKRWKPATAWNPDTAWNKPSRNIDGTTWGEACLQTGKAKVEPNACLPPELEGEAGPLGSEDCLTLNVYTPADPDSTAPTRLPVVVWIHGGNYMRGTANSCSFDGTRFASKQGVVVVTVNYRLGVLGFLGNFGDDDSKMGNFGIRDQRLSLKWVQDHIAAFGGDPDNVTIWGESAGASSVGVHLASEASQPLFDRAMMDSNHYGMRFATPEQARLRAKLLMNLTPTLNFGLCPTKRCMDQLGCGSLTTEKRKIECLRSCDATHVLNDANRRTTPLRALNKQGLGGSQYWGPMVESTKTTKGDDIAVQVQPIDSAPHTLGHAVLVGTNGSEGSNVKTDIIRDGPPASIAFEGSMGSAFGGLLNKRRQSADRIFDAQKAERRQANEKVDYASLTAQLITDYNFGCATEHVMAGRASAVAEVVTPTYAYFFDVTHPSYNFLQFSDETGICEEEACHGNELPYVWGNPAYFEGVVWPEHFTTAEQEFSDQLGDYLGGFIREGVPSWAENDEPIAWPEFVFDESAGGGRYLKMSGRFDDSGSRFDILATGLGSAESASPLPNQQCLALDSETPSWTELGWPAKSAKEQKPPKDADPYGPPL